jgi:hypothetical protein
MLPVLPPALCPLPPQVDPRKRQQRAGVEEEEDDDEDYEEDEEESDRQSKVSRILNRLRNPLPVRRICLGAC